MQTHPIPQKHLGLPRTADEILSDIQDERLQEHASSYFGCFRFQQRGIPCNYCRMNQLNVLHCMDSQEERCLCLGCRKFQQYAVQCCEEYPSDILDASDGEYNAEE